MRPLVIDEGARVMVRQVLSYAMDHPYELSMEGDGEDGGVPGDNPHHVCHLGTYRCVYSFTRMGEVTYRDLSVSIPAQGKYPNPYAVYAIAELFGFTGWNGQTIEPVPEGWQIAQDMVWTGAIRVVQEIET